MHRRSGVEIAKGGTSLTPIHTEIFIARASSLGQKKNMDSGERLHCLCIHCSAGIEFSIESLGHNIPCPHCGSETQLYQRTQSRAGKRRSNKTILFFCIGSAILIGITGTWYFSHNSRRKTANKGSIAPSNSSPVQWRRLSGQIFIVQENRETLKLSMVPIQLIPTRVASERISAAQGEAERNIISLEARQARIKIKLPFLKRMHELQGQLVNTTGRFIGTSEKLVNTYFSESNDRELPAYYRNESRTLLIGAQKTYAKAKADYQAALDGFNQQAPEVTQLETESKDVESKLSYYRSLDGYFSAPWQKVISEASSDSDGKFSIQVPADGAFTLTAHTSRLTLAGRESFGWMVPAKLDGEQPLMLNNVNLLSAQRDKPSEVISAAGTGNADAQFRAGVLLICGKSVPEDYIEALKWLTLSSNQGNESSTQLRKDLSMHLDLNDRNEGERRAAQFTIRQ